MMPGNIHYVFKDYLNLLRLNWPIFNDALTDRYSYRLNQDSPNMGKGCDNVLLEASDYVHLFGHNLVVVCIAGLCILLTWLVLTLKDRFQHKLPSAVRRRCPKGNHEPQANNFALRFFYEFFLEVSICAMINLAHLDFSSFSHGAHWIMSFTVGIVILVYLIWLFSLFYKNGPFLSGFYKRGTFLESFWVARPFDTTFSAQLGLEKLTE